MSDVLIDTTNVTLYDELGNQLGTPAHPLYTSVSTATTNVQSNVVVSSGNSSTTPLTANSTFTGTFEALSNYISITIIVNTNSLPTTGGLNVDFSTDGINVDRTVSVDVTTGGCYVSLGHEALYVRVRLTAGNSNQTYLRLQTQYLGTANGLKVVPLIDTVNDSSAALLTKGLIVGKTTGGGGGYVSVKVNPSGSLTTDASGSVIALDSTTLAALETITANQGTAGTSAWPIADSTDQEYNFAAGSLSTSGDNNIITPPAGKSVRIHWIYAINNPTATTAPRITVKIGVNTYYVVWALSKRQRITGPVNGSLVINLSSSGDVAYTVIYEYI